ncbi:hypothetical protein FE782_04120 [Paenibacillus antri]|uniref:Mutator family transposase n=1 Tax=Paenibacillus antri TaxID=2582848 RepID=A0A5R9GN57_9BACL|nr:hypothetical protein FE782_04120 [Paenibacillus antri]
MTTLQQTSINNLFENLVRDFVKEKLELIMNEEMKNFIQVEHPDHRNTRNGYYERTLDTRHGRIDDLQVPRDRRGEFETQVFKPYQRRDEWLDEAITQMYRSGMSTREVARFVDCMFGTKYSPTTVSNITDAVLDDIESWQNRPLEKRYSVIYLDGIYCKLKRDTVRSEVIYLAMGPFGRGSSLRIKIPPAPSAWATLSTSNQFSILQNQQESIVPMDALLLTQTS